MRTKLLLLCGVLMSIAASPALAQPAPTPSPAMPGERTTAPTPIAPTAGWRASKLVGLNVYNTANEKVGDISEILLDTSGKVSGVIIGVGGFLGLGQHDVLVQMEQLKFVNEPRPSTTTTTTTAPTSTTPPTAGTTTARSANEKWYPDHATMNATKDQLKEMPCVQVQLSGQRIARHVWFGASFRPPCARSRADPRYCETSSRCGTLGAWPFTLGALPTWSAILAPPSRAAWRRLPSCRAGYGARGAARRRGQSNRPQGYREGSRGRHGRAAALSRKIIAVHTRSPSYLRTPEDSRDRCGHAPGPFPKGCPGFSENGHRASGTASPPQNAAKMPT
jgi:sporulation protein YlmC with PRC-barrel domain